MTVCRIMPDRLYAALLQTVMMAKALSPRPAIVLPGKTV